MAISAEALLVVLLVGLTAGRLAGQIVQRADFGLVGDLEAPAKRLDASLEVAMDVHGTTVSIIHGAPFASRSSAANPVWRLDSWAGAPGWGNPVDATPQDGS